MFRVAPSTSSREGRADRRHALGETELALTLEEVAAATYLSAQKVLTDKAAVMLAGSIQIVDAQHAAIL